MALVDGCAPTKLCRGGIGLKAEDARTALGFAEAILLYCFTLERRFTWVSSKPLQWLLTWLNRIGKDHALGGLGLLLSVLGLCFEFYQVITLCVHDGCYQFLL